MDIEVARYTLESAVNATEPSAGQLVSPSKARAPADAERGRLAPSRARWG